MVSIRWRHSLPSSTGVLPVLTTCLGPRTADAGLLGATWPVISQSSGVSAGAATKHFAPPLTLSPGSLEYSRTPALVKKGLARYDVPIFPSRPPRGRSKNA